MFTSIPTIHFGLLEGLLVAIKEAVRAGKRLHGLRISTYFNSHGTTGEKITDVKLIVTSLTTDEQGAFAQYGLWVYHLATHGEAYGRSLWAWSGQDSDQLAREATDMVADIIEQEVGIAPHKGSMFCIPIEWLAVGGGTDLFQLALLRELVKPGEGMRVKRLCAPGAELVLGTISEGRFAELAISDLKADERIRLVSPDLIHQWLVYPDRYDNALAAKTAALERPPTYRLLYNPEQGWLDERVVVGSA